MTQNVDPVFLKTPLNVAITIAAADTTTKKDAFTAGTNGGAIVSLSATSADASDITLVLSYNDGSTDFQLGEVLVPAGAGTNGTAAAKDLLDSSAMPGVFDADGSFVLSANTKLRINAKATVGGDVNIVGIAGDY